MTITAKIIADSISPDGVRLTTFQLHYPLYIHAQVMTHRCLVADTQLTFDLPSGSKNTKLRSYNMTIGEFHDKWHNGSKLRIPSRYVEKDTSGIDPVEYYSPSQLAKAVGYASPTNIVNACRKGELVISNPERSKGDPYKIKGSDFIHWCENPKSYRQNIRDRLNKMLIRALDVDTGEVIHTNVTDIWEVGEKETYTLTAGEYSITGTSDHLVLTTEGWKELGSLGNGEYFVIVTSRKKEKLADAEIHKKINGKWRSTWQNQQRKILTEAQQGKCSECQKETKLEIHHVIPVHEDPNKCFDTNNIVAICGDCHQEKHKTQGWQEGNYLGRYPVRVDSVVPTGKVQKVYDLSVADHNHNFVANGLIVHNCFSRNVASNRAIPTKTVISRTLADPAIPKYFGKNQSGMQPAGNLEGIRAYLMSKVFYCGLYISTALAWAASKLGGHKEIVNRLLMPYQHVDTILTATDFENYFDLRLDSDTQGTHQELACAMENALLASNPVKLKEGEWHLPYVSDAEKQKYKEERTLLSFSAARCARVSYLTHDKKEPSESADLRLAKILLTSKHMSPFEHQAMVPDKYNPYTHSNLRGWHQYRKELELLNRFSSDDQS